MLKVALNTIEQSNKHLVVEETGVPGEDHPPVTVTDKLYHIILYREARGGGVLYILVDNSV